MRPRHHLHYPRTIVPESPLVPLAIALRNLLLALAAGCVLVSTCEAEAQGTAETTLARMAIGESDWNARDQSAVLHVVARRAARAGVSVEQMSLRYSSVFAGKPTPRKRWVLAIESSCEQPTAWPKHLRWDRYRARCLATFERVQRFLRGELPDPCRGRANHFGSATIAVDVERAARAGWRRVSCGGAVNAFWARGRR